MHVLLSYNCVLTVVKYTDMLCYVTALWCAEYMHISNASSLAIFILRNPQSGSLNRLCSVILLTAVHIWTLQIIRIQNPLLYQQYMVRKATMCQQHAASNTQVERMLWHGTSPDNLDSIKSTGFNRSYCGRNGMQTSPGRFLML